MIAVTGMGIVSPYGVGTDAYAGGFSVHHAINPCTGPELSGFGLEGAGVVEGFVPKKHIPPMKARRMSRFSQLALVASQEALRGSGLEMAGESAVRTGVVVGTGLGSVYSTDSFFEGLVRRGPAETNPILFPETVQNIAAAHISIELGIRGPNTTFSQGDIAGEFAIYYAAGLLNKGVVDAVLVCGADELTRPVLAGMRALNILSRRGKLAPFDRGRDGIIPGEGAAAVVLERADDAERRGAVIHGLITGFGFSADMVERLDYSSPEPIVRAMSAAIEDSGLTPDLVSASANSTVTLDRNEAEAIRILFGGNVAVTALKSQVGSFMSSGVMKLVAALVWMQHGTVPPVFGLSEPEVTGPFYIMGNSEKRRIDSCLINGCSHGGSNMSILVMGGSAVES